MAICSTKAVFDLTKYRFSFIVNGNLDSLANGTVCICWCCRKWHHCSVFTYSSIKTITDAIFTDKHFRVLLVNPRRPCQNWICKSGFRFTHWMEGFTKSNLNLDSVNQIRPKNDLGPPFRGSTIPGYYCYNNPNPNPNPRIPRMADLQNGGSFKPSNGLCSFYCRMSQDEEFKFFSADISNFLKYSSKQMYLIGSLVSGNHLKVTVISTYCTTWVPFIISHDY